LEGEASVWNLGKITQNVIDQIIELDNIRIKNIRDRSKNYVHNDIIEKEMKRIENERKRDRSIEHDNQKSKQLKPGQIEVELHSNEYIDIIDDNNE